MKIINSKIVISTILSFTIGTCAFANERSLISINAKAYGLYLKGNYNSSFAVYKRGLNLYPDSASLYDGIGAVYLKQKQFNQAYNNFNKASQLDNSNSLYKIHAHEAIYKSNINKLNQSKYLISIAYALASQNHDIRKNFENVRENKFKSLESIYYVCQNLKDINLSNGNKAFWKKDFKKAEQFYQKSIKLQPKNYEALNNLGLAYLEMSSVNKAITNFRKASNLNPGLAQAYNNLGIAYMKQNKFDEANRNFGLSIKYGKYYFPAYNNKAVCLARSSFENINISIKYLEPIVKAEPSNIAAKQTLALFLSLNESYNEAINVYKSGLDSTKDNLNYLKLYADCLYEAGQYQDAIIYYKKAVLINAENPNIFVGMARAQEKNNELQNAFASYQTALRIDSRNLDANKYFGLYLLNQNRKAEAKAFLQKYVRLSPNSYDCDYIKKLI